MNKGYKKHSKLFDSGKRTYFEIKSYSESEFKYINRSALKHCEKIRFQLKQWFTKYPKRHRQEFLSRFRNSEDFEFYSAFYELYLYGLFSQMGFDVEIHPVIEEKETHPEFLVKIDNTKVYYLEATSVAGSRDKLSTKKREDIVYDTLNKMNSPNFFLGVDVRGFPNTPPPGAKWRDFLEKQLSMLDPNTVTNQLKTNEQGALPSWSTNHDGWDVTFYASPKPPKLRGKKGIRPIGVRGISMRQLREHEYIHSSIKAKATKYGDLNLPFIIGVNVVSLFKNEKFIKDALFGQEIVVDFLKQDGTTKHKLSRKANGVWNGPKGPQNTRVSAVLISWYLTPKNIVKETPVLWHNPWAKYPLDENILSLPQVIIDRQSGLIERKPGKNAKEIFNLSGDWPLD